jgi:hypothetical protein
MNLCVSLKNMSMKKSSKIDMVQELSKSMNKKSKKLRHESED